MSYYRKTVTICSYCGSRIDSDSQTDCDSDYLEEDPDYSQEELSDNSDTEEFRKQKPPLKRTKSFYNNQEYPISQNTGYQNQSKAD